MTIKSKRKGEKRRAPAKAKKSTATTSKRRALVKAKSVRKPAAVLKVVRTPRPTAPTFDPPTGAAPRIDMHPAPILFWPGLPFAMMSMWMAPVRAAFGR